MDRSNSDETPMAMHSNGSKNRTRNARIFPLRVAVSPGHNLQIEFQNALEQLKKLVDVKFDPARWISTTSTIVQGGMDLTMADVDDYLTDSG